MSVPDPAPPPAIPPPASPSSPFLNNRRWLLALPILAGILLLLIAAAVIIVIVLANIPTEEEPDAGIPLQVVRITPTPTPPVSPVPPPVPSGCRAVVGSGDVQASLSLPVSLTLGITTFPVEVVAPQAGGWGYPAGSAGTAAWTCGTVVNYVVALEPTAENETLLAGLRVGDEIMLHRANGAVLLFHFAELRDGVPADDANTLQQFQPRLTLILEKQDGTWQVAAADYFTEIAPIPPSLVGPLAQLEQLVIVGDVQVTVLRGHAERGADLPAGAMYYLVEFSIENTGSEPLDAGAFSMRLQDSLGNEYLRSSAASVTGDYGQLGGQVDPGQTVTGTAGYLVADTLAGPKLFWTFRPFPGSGLQASVEIPYESGAVEPPLPAKASVNIYEARLSSDGSTLIVEGWVQNVGGAPLTVALTDISLSSSAGLGEPLMIAPPLPWTVEPGQMREFELQYPKPGAAAAVLTVSGFSFEISGLQD